MQPKPEDFGTHYAEEFKRQEVVDAYRNRPPYPAEVFDILVYEQALQKLRDKEENKE